MRTRQATAIIPYKKECLQVLFLKVFFFGKVFRSFKDISFLAPANIRLTAINLSDGSNKSAKLICPFIPLSNLSFAIQITPIKVCIHTAAMLIMICSSLPTLFSGRIIYNLNPWSSLTNLAIRIMRTAFRYFTVQFLCLYQKINCCKIYHA